MFDITYREQTRRRWGMRSEGKEGREGRKEKLVEMMEYGGKQVPAVGVTIWPQHTGRIWMWMGGDTCMEQGC
jgi:hypothetical protein